jgi:hypothetical protein
LLAGPPETAAATKAEPTVDVAKAVEAAQMAAARVPQAETLLDTILRDKEPLHEDLEKRMILLNKGMRKCALPSVKSSISASA